MSDTRILVTNDDGIDSPGLRALARDLARTHDVVVAAPSKDMSGSGTAIGRFDPTTGVEMHPVTDLDGVEAYAIDGPPGLAVTAGMLGAFGDPPDLVASGVNGGLNTGHTILHSGTVGAALTARTFGGRGCAISLAQSDPWQWDTATVVGASVIRWMADVEGPPFVLNVNVPASPLGAVRGIEWAPLDDVGTMRVAAADIPGGRLQFVIGGSSHPPTRGCDTALCNDGYATVTPLLTVERDEVPDVPAAALWSP